MNFQTGARRPTSSKPCPRFEDCDENYGAANVTQLLRMPGERTTLEHQELQRAAAPRPTTQPQIEVPQLVILEGRSAGRRVLVLDGMVLGRDNDCDLKLDDSFASRHHARFVFENDDWFLTDTSRNGTWINGKVATDTNKLQFGDRLRVGNTLLLFSRRDSLEEDARHHQRLETLGRLGAGVAHDINNILASVMVNADLLALYFASNEHVSEPERECVEDIRLAAKRGAELAKRILDHSKTGSNDDTNVDLGAVVRDVIQLLRRTFAAGISIEADLAEGVLVRGNRGSLQQVVMNLLVNARDAVEGNGLITVRLAISAATPSHVAFADRHVELTVRDNGKGIPSEVMPHILEPFFTTKKGNGAGVGLATVSDIVRDHGGQLSFVSRLGEGAEFTVTLPTLTTQTSAPMYTPSAGLVRPALPGR